MKLSAGFMKRVLYEGNMREFVQDPRLFSFFQFSAKGDAINHEVSREGAMSSCNITMRCVPD
jgi:hypothetical protein